MMNASSRPYLLRGLHEWLLDNGLTPYVIVDAEQPGVQVPQPYVRDGQIVLNVSPDATRHLMIDNHGISFSARFGGAAMQLNIPVAAVMAIYARENGAGMVFGSEPTLEAGSDEPLTDDSVDRALEVVHQLKDDDDVEVEDDTSAESEQVWNEPTDTENDDDDDDHTPPGGGRGSHLRVIK